MADRNMVRQGTDRVSDHFCVNVCSRIESFCLFVFSGPYTVCASYYHVNNIQASFVSLSTSAFTGAHSICLFVVVVWFIYQLKHGTKPVKWAEDALLRMKEALMRNISPLFMSDRSRHYQRNACL